MDTFSYRKVTGEDDDGLPFVVEAAFACLEEGEDRRLVCGVNWSASIVNPFRELRGDSLSGILREQRAGPHEPVVLLVHLATPRARYTDRGKSAVVVDDRKAEAITQAVKHVTSRWAKQRRAEDRESSRIANRRAALVRSRKMSLKDAAWRVMPAAYFKASSGGKLPAKTRQIFYAARGKILALTGKDKLTQQYFSQTLVPAYMDEHPEETTGWDVVYDARGKLTEPHTKAS